MGFQWKTHGGKWSCPRRARSRAIELSLTSPSKNPAHKLTTNVWVSSGKINRTYRLSITDLATLLTTRKNKFFPLSNHHVLGWLKIQELTDSSKSAVHASLCSSRAEIVPLVRGVPNNQHRPWSAQDNKYLLTNTSILLMVTASVISHLLPRITANGRFKPEYQICYWNRLVVMINIYWVFLDGHSARPVVSI